MIGRKSVVGLSLLAVLAFCAFAAQSASAAWQNATNTTAFTCVEGKTKDFSDAHCDTGVVAGTGKFGHELIPSGATPIETSNTQTASGTTAAEIATLKGTLAGVKVEITCKKVEPDLPEGKNTSFIENKGVSTTHEVTGTSAVNFTECSVAKPVGCSVVEPITVKSKFHGIEEPVEKTMALEFEPDGSENFVEIKFGATCGAISNLTFPVKGTAKATGGTATQKEKWAGATAVFEPGNGMQNLTLGGNKAEFSAKFTTKMAINGVEPTNPITLTTAT